MGNTFDILTYGSRSGVFGTVLGALIPGGNQFQLGYLTNTCSCWWCRDPRLADHAVASG